MVSKSLLCAFALTTVVIAQFNNDDNDNNNNDNNNNNNDNGDATTLNEDAIQTGSFFDGSDGLGAEDGQAASETSENNFINFCSGQTLTNGLQITDGSCNGIVMGQIPSKDNMISSIITFPQNGDTVQAGQDFTISVQTNGLEAGSFTNADATYYSAPQQVNGNGNVVGHTHVTVQDLGSSLNPEQPPDPTQFAFFKGINDAGNGQGLLSADVEGGLPAGNYRVCTLTSASNHQPVIMPVAQRGAQDDCTKFTVTDDGNNDDQNNDDQNADDQNADDQNVDDQNADDQNADDQNADDQNADDQNNDNNNNFNFGGNNNNNGFNGFGGFGNKNKNKRSRLAKVAARRFVA